MGTRVQAATTDAVHRRVIVVAPTGRDASLVADLLRKAGYDSEACASIADACAAIRIGAGAGIIAEEALDPDRVAELSTVLRDQPPWSNFPLILLTVAGEVTVRSQRRRAMREPLGNVFLLERPVRPETLISTVDNALRSRSRQYQMREQLEQFSQAQEALRKSEKLAVAGRLAASIAHEINNPLESVTNLLFLMRNADPASYAAYLAQAEQELTRVTEITKHTLHFYREPARPGPVDVAAVLESVLTLYHPKIASAGVQVQREFEAADPILGASGELRQVFSNLIINAVDAMRRGGCLTVRIRNRRDPANQAIRGVRISIADTGMGIPKAMLHRIFEPFVTTKGETGTGLGLWVTAEIVHKLSGRIRVRSRIASRQNEPAPNRPASRSSFPPARKKLQRWHSPANSWPSAPQARAFLLLPGTAE
jgi:signal transduction histidine kinase